MDDSETALREWIRAHQVTWERQPHVEVLGAKTVRTGYDFTLFARNPDSDGADAGSPECRRIHEELRRVVAAALPASGAAGSGVALGPFAPELTLRAESGWQPEVELDVEVYRPGGVTAAGAEQAACVASLESGLRRLGARYGAWSVR